MAVLRISFSTTLAIGLTLDLKNLLTKVLRRLSGAMHQSYWLLINFRMAIRLKKVPILISHDFCLEPLAKARLNDMFCVYKKFTGSSKIPLKMRILFYVFGERLGVIACDKNGEFVGGEIYYFNSRDCLEKTVHQGFTGVNPEARGKGVATAIRNHAKLHFKANRIEGISSRVSLSNVPSLKSNLNLGFKPVEKYYDSVLGDERYYLVCKLNNIE
jgi:GNAT superfamily N-acetyltransferase